MKSSTHQRTFWDKFWRDEHGNDVILKRPNKLFLIWAVTAFLRLFLHGGLVEDFLRAIGLIALVLWCLVEIAWGVNYFWRSIGFMVLVIIIFANI
jgi:hypothetical protein